MSRIALNAPDNKNRPPNTGDSAEYGDNWKTVIDNINTMTTELYAGVQLADGSTAVKPSGNITTSLTTIGSSATNTTQTLASYTLPANSLNTNGNAMQITAWGRCASNAAPKTIALNVGGQFISTGSSNGNNTAWKVSGYVIRTSANNQKGYFEALHSNALVAPKSSTDTSVDTTTMGISITCLDASAAQSNILLDGMAIEYFK